MSTCFAWVQNVLETKRLCVTHIECEYLALVTARLNTFGRETLAQSLLNNVFLLFSMMTLSLIKEFGIVDPTKSNDSAEALQSCTARP